MRITESQLRRIIRESLADEFRERLLARKKHYDDLAAQPLPYREGDLIVVGDRRWTGTVNDIPALIEPGTELEALRITSTTSGEFALTEPAVLQVPDSVIRMMNLKRDTIAVEPGDTIIISGAQIRNVRGLVESSLRRIIREALLTEAAMTPREAKLRGLNFKVEKQDDYVEISVYEQGRKWVGSLSSHAEEDPCSGAWTIDGSYSQINGLGPLMYDLMIDLIHPHPLASDRAEVSPDARRVWDSYLDRRDDMEVIQLDDPDNTLTPVDDDNCEQSSALIWADEVAGDEDEWPESSLSKAFRRPTGEGTPLLDELQDLGLITFI